MGLSVGLGVGYQGEDVEMLLVQLTAIVKSGCTNRLREIYRDEGERKILEVTLSEGRVESRTLGDEEAAPILEEAAEVEEEQGDIAACFSWDELEAFGANDAQPFAVEFDVELPRDEVSVDLPRQYDDGAPTSTRVVSLLRSQMNWLHDSPACDQAWRLHRLARRHRLVVYSA